MQTTGDAAGSRRVLVREGLFELFGSDRLRLRAARCVRCERLSFPPGGLCLYCGASEIESTLLDEEAEVVWSTVVSKAPPGFEGSVPYGLGVVQFAGGLALVAPLVIRQALPRGARVRSVPWEVGQDEGGHTLVTFAFRPVRKGGREEDSVGLH